MKKVYYPGRILERNVGGNTTYTRAIAEGIKEYGWEVDTLPYHSKAPVTALMEQYSGAAETRLRRRWCTTAPTQARSSLCDAPPW